MAKRLFGRQVLNLIFDDESNLKIVKAAMERTGQAAANIRSKAIAVTNRKNPKKVTMSTCGPIMKESYDTS